MLWLQLQRLRCRAQRGHSVSNMAPNVISARIQTSRASRWVKPKTERDPRRRNDFASVSAPQKFECAARGGCRHAFDSSHRHPPDHRGELVRGRQMRPCVFSIAHYAGAKSLTASRPLVVTPKSMLRTSLVCQRHCLWLGPVQRSVAGWTPCAVPRIHDGQVAGMEVLGRRHRLTSPMLACKHIIIAMMPGQP